MLVRRCCHGSVVVTREQSLTVFVWATAQGTVLFLVTININGSFGHGLHPPISTLAASAGRLKLVDSNNSKVLGQDSLDPHDGRRRKTTHLGCPAPVAKSEHFNRLSSLLLFPSRNPIQFNPIQSPILSYPIQSNSIISYPIPSRPFISLRAFSVILPSLFSCSS